MKFLYLSLIILLSIGCRKTEEGWGELSQAERDYITNRAKEKCTESFVTPQKNFIENTTEMFASSAYDRGVGYLSTFKEGSTDVSKVEVRVWSRKTDTLYFIVTEYTNTDEVSDYYYLKITQTQNEDMIKDLFSEGCLQNTDKIYAGVSSGDSGPLSISYAYSNPVSGATQTAYTTDSYTFNFNELAFIAAFRMSRKVETKEDDSGTIVSTKNYTASYASKSYPSGYPSNDYSDSRFPTKFCEFAEEAANIYRLSKTVKGFKKSCATSLPGDWDMSI